MGFTEGTVREEARRSGFCNMPDPVPFTKLMYTNE